MQGGVSTGHLHPELQALAGWSAEDRIKFVTSDTWVSYPAAEDVLAKLTDLLTESPNQARRRGYLISARADNGKTALLRQFQDMNPVTSPDTGETTMPVLLISMPEKPSDASFWSAVLQALRAPHRVGDPSRVLRAQALETMRYLKVRMLVIDEIHNLLEGSAREQSAALVMLKMLSNELTIPLVAAGTKAALQALMTDNQLATRFKVAGLPPWRTNRSTRDFLFSMESVLPLMEPSGLADPDLMQNVMLKAHETVDGIVFVLRETTKLAIRSGVERITTGLVKQVDSSNLTTMNIRDLEI